MQLSNLWKKKHRELPPGCDLLAPIIEAAEQHEEEIQLEYRSARERQLAELDAEERGVMPAQIDAVRMRNHAVVDVKLQLERVERQARDAETARLSTSLDLQFRRDKIKSELYAAAPSVIDDAIRELYKLFEDTRLKSDLRETVSEPNRVGDRKRIFSGNIESINSRLSAIRNAIAEAEKLKITALPVNEIVVRLTELLKTIPELRDVKETFDRVDVSALR